MNPLNRLSTINIVIGTSVCLLVAFAFQNCGQFKSKVDKNESTTSNSVSGPGATANTTGTTNSTTGGATTGSTSGTNTGTTTGSNPGTTTGSTTGTPTFVTNGNIFAHNPQDSANNPALAFNANLSPYKIQAQLLHLDKTASYLTNGRVKLEHDDAFPNAIVKPTDNLLFEPSNSGFQFINAYFHLDQLIDMVNTANLFPSNYVSVNVIAHCTSGSDSVNNAYFSSQSNNLCLGYTNPGTNIWAADDADIVVHEYGHALNHAISSPEILFSTSENGGLDEGFADLWALSQSRDPHIAEWFGRAVYASHGNYIIPFLGIRDLTQTPTYPNDLRDERHDDSIFLSSAIYELSNQSGLSDPHNLVKLMGTMLLSLQSLGDLAQPILVLREEAAKYGISSTQLNTVLSTRGLHRRDDPALLALDASVPIKVVDNNIIAEFQANGNCNGVLQPNESAFIYPNFKNNGAALGHVVASLTTTAPNDEIEILPGGDFAQFLRFNSGSSYFGSGLNAAKGSDRYINFLFGASFGIKASAKAHGTYNFTMVIKGIDTIDLNPATKNFTFTVTVPTTAPASTCNATTQAAVWP